MEIHVEFWFRGMQHSCIALVDSSEYPCYIFIMLNGPGLISEFGDEITIATDGKKRLPGKGDHAALAELSQAILNVIKEAAEFRAVEIKMRILNQKFEKISTKPTVQDN
ncbi:MAG TPA: hypothetical protein VD993_19735 [Chitinophagaceae bacterium]|nr:hypothetical protein [Chitinophagaceae bacterium]